jgi:RNase H-fold protein (predicted Holliday junction resolvase)
MSKFPQQPILAIVPGTRHIGIAVIRADELVYFAIRSFKGKKTKQRLFSETGKCLAKLTERYHPGVLAIKEPSHLQARLSRFLPALTGHIKACARERGLKVLPMRLIEAKRHFFPQAPTGEALAQVMVCQYPVLRAVAKRRTTRQAKVYWQQMFDAIGLGAFASCRLLRKAKCDHIPSSRIGAEPVMFSANTAPFPMAETALRFGLAMGTERFPQLTF